ncbi:MAG: hypothetical protein AAF699_17270 [Pseudomonadota bacterium]
MSWFWNYFQQRQIRDGQVRADYASIDAKKANSSIAELEEKVDRLSLLCHALFEELQQATGLTEEQLRERITQIDLRDGKLDGKFKPETGNVCPECGHKNKSSRSNCYWCGAKLNGVLDSLG